MVLTLVVVAAGAARAGATTADLTLPPRVIWHSSEGHVTLGSWHPAVADDRLVVPGRFAIEALALDDGQRLWSASLPTPPRVAMIDQGTLVAGGRVGLDPDGNALPDLHRIDPESGAVLWSRVVGGVFAAPLRRDDRLVVASTHALVVLGADDGSETWRIDFPRDADGLPGGPAEAGPLLVGEQVVTGAGDLQLHAYALADGAPLWSVPLARRLYTKPATAAGLVVCPSGAALMAVEVATGTVRWQVPLAGEPLLARPAIAGDTVYVSSGSGRTLVALALEDGAVRWETPLPAVCHTEPALTHTMLWIGDVDGRLLALDRRDGALLWQDTLGGSYLSDPVVAGERLVVGADGGELAVLASTVPSVSLLPGTPALRIGPNPAREQVRIQTAAGRIEIFDVQGRCVRVLAGHGIPLAWDGRDAAGRRLASATYFIRVTTADGGAQHSAKLQLLD
ncbi:MAG: PQQ-binding-like beta-propeller repeat protein [Candidatus Eiseniibacteriota bacterium]